MKTDHVLLTIRPRHLNSDISIFYEIVLSKNV